MTSAGMRSSIARATAVLPLAVGPKSARTASATKTRANELQVVRGEAAGAEIALDASVPPSKFLENARDRLGRSRRDAADALALGLAAGFGHPQVVAGLQPPPPPRIIGGKLLVIHAREGGQERRQQAPAGPSPRPGGGPPPPPAPR